MHIAVRCFASLARYAPAQAEGYELSPGASVAELIAALGIPSSEIKLVFVNGNHVEPGAVLAEGDRVGLFPAVGGG
jgi:sulfur carrier protein ThiS